MSLARILLFLAVLAGVSIAALVHSEPAATSQNTFKVFVSGTGIEYGRTSIAMPIVEQLKAQVLAENFKNRLPADKTTYKITVPSNKVTEFIGVGGKTITQFDLTEIRITRFDFNKAKTNLIYGANKNSVGIRIADLYLDVRAMGIWDGRTVRVEGGVNGITASMTVTFSVADAKPSIRVTSGSLALAENNLALEVKQGLGGVGNWLINQIIGFLKPTAVRMIHEQFQANYQKPNDFLKTIFDGLPLTKVVRPADLPKLPAAAGNNFKINKPIVARVSLTNAPEFTPAGLSLFFDAHVYTEGNSQCSRLCRPRVTPNPSGSTFVQVQISDFMPCCILTAAHELGLMNYKGKLDPVPKFELPPEYKEGLEPLVTAVINKYKVSYALTAKYTPVVTFGRETVAIALNDISIKIFVEDKEIEAPPKIALDITVSANLAARIRLVGNVIYPTVTRAALTLGNFQSFLPEITDVIKAPVQNLIDVIISAKVLPMANKILEKGFALPVLQGMTFVQPQLTIETGFLRVGTSFTYNNPIRVTLPQTRLDLLVQEPAKEHILPPYEQMPFSGGVAPWPEDGSDDNLISKEDRRVVSANEDNYESYIDLDAIHMVKFAEDETSSDPAEEL